MKGPLTGVPDAVLKRFVAQRERLGDGERLDVAALPPFGRCLLVTDGNVTTLIEAYALEQIRTRCLDQTAGRPTPREMHWLAIESPTPTIARRVVLEGVVSNTVYLAAFSLMVPTRLPRRFINALRCESTGIGAALISTAVEHRRELLWFNHVANALYSRTYRIFVLGRPALLITEDFYAAPRPGPHQPCP
jgi:chorismate-pyruvate lyase